MSSAAIRLALRFARAGLLLAGFIAGAGAQTAFSPARLWDGRTPDFRGIWQVRGTAYVNIEGHPAAKGIAAGKSIIVDPSGGKIPCKPEALQQRQENYRARATADPSLRCCRALPHDWPRCAAV